MENALQIIILKSPASAGDAVACLRAYQAGSLSVQARFNRVVNLAFSDPLAEFTPSERLEIASLVVHETDDRATARIQLRISPSEKAIIEEEADRLGQSISEYIRRKVLR